MSCSMTSPGGRRRLRRRAPRVSLSRVSSGLEPRWGRKSRAELEVVAFVATRPSHVDIDTVVIRPRDQARVWLAHRE